ncbi:MAG: hypothetical protein D3921_06785 [Candidatus Electrothrix sp. AW1]|nr:hypothetical protein [Candidatus Electrothrix sp. AX1]MCI5182207.1 hypothetical protein [Candidatus Electrothrix gigas]
MNKWKSAFWVCFVLLIFTNLFWGYSVINQAVSYSYLEVSFYEQKRANKVLGNLIVLGGKQFSQKDFLHLLRQAYPDEFIVEKDNRITMFPNTFEFENNRLSEVK